MNNNGTVLGILAEVLHTNSIKHLVFSGNPKNICGIFENDNTFIISKKCDRRSAGYFTMGLAQRTDQVAWLFCEGDNAGTVDVLPALTEAQNQNVPMVVCAIGSNEYISDTCNLLKDKCRAVVNVDLDHIQLSSELLSALYRVIASAKQFDKGPVLLYITGNLEKELKLDADTQKVEIITQDVFYHTIEKTKRELREASICAYFDPFIEYNEEMLDTVCGFINEYNVAASLHEPYKLLPYINNSIDEGKNYDVLISFSDSLSPEATCEVSRIKAKEKWLISLGGCSDSVRDSINRFYLCGSQLFMSLVSQKQKSTLSKIDNGKTSGTLLEEVLIKLVSACEGRVNVLYGCENRIAASRALAHCQNAFSAAYTTLQGGEGTLSVLIGQSVIYESVMNICVLSVTEFLRDINAIHIRHYKDNVRIIVVSNPEDEDTISRLKSWLTDYKINSKDVFDKKSLEEVLCSFSQRDGQVYAAFVKE